MAKRPYLECDTECAVGWWLLKFYFPMGNMLEFELSASKLAFTYAEQQQLALIFANYTLVTFNGLNYDVPMIRLAMAGVGVGVLKQANDAIIVGGLKRWNFLDAFPMAAHIPGLDHIDIMEVTPGVRIGLKTYMARMHSRTIADLPFDPVNPIPEHMLPITREYCGNDLRGTRELRETIRERLELRERYTDELRAELQQRGIDMYVDLRSKSDAQMSEAIVQAKLGYRPQVPYIPSGYTFKLQPAPWLEFVTPQMQEVFELCKRVDFLWSRNDDGEVMYGPDGKKIKTGVSMPAELVKLRIAMGRSVYKFGIGGLHSTESAQTIFSSPAGRLRDSDVGSFYPSMVILMRLLSPEIQAIYEDIYHTRMNAKGKNKSLADVLKTALNGAYGKFWSKYSFLCNPQAGIGITINGQLSLLMLAERLELAGISVVSANTDGIVTLTPPGLEYIRDSTIAWWEARTGLTMEHKDYRSIHMRDVNSYVAIDSDGKAKRKGVFSESGVLASMQGVHPDRDIAKDAVVAYLQHGTPMAQTIRACRDVRKFVLSRKVKGAGQWRGSYIGSTVRWYYSTAGEPIRYVSNGNKVAGSDGAQPIQVLPDHMPADVDYAQYEAYAAALLAATGYPSATP